MGMGTNPGLEPAGAQQVSLGAAGTWYQGGFNLARAGSPRLLHTQQSINRGVFGAGGGATSSPLGGVMPPLAGWRESQGRRRRAMLLGAGSGGGAGGS